MGRKTQKAKSKTLQPHVSKPSPRIKPGTDFYKYINQDWLTKTHIPSWMSSYGVSEEIEELIAKELVRILDSTKSTVSQRKNSRIPFETKLLGTFVTSILQMNTQSTQKDLSFARSVLAEIQCIHDVEDVGRVLGKLNRYHVPTCLLLFTNPSEEDAHSNYICFTSGNLGLRDHSYYLEATPFNLTILEKYTSLFMRLEEEFQYPGLSELVSLEKEAAKQLVKSMNDEEWKGTGANLQKEFPAIPWTSIAEGAFQMKESQFLSTSFLNLSTTWYTFLNKWFRSLSIESWKHMLSAQWLLFCCPFLHEPYETLSWNLFQHTLRGESKKMPRIQLALYLCQQWLPGPLGSLFLQCCVESSVKQRTTHLVHDIQMSASSRLGSLDWFSPTTRQAAKRKIEAMHFGIAYPEHLKSSYSHLEKIQLSYHELVKNIVTLAEADFQKDLDAVGQSLQFEKWDDPIFSVNAYYYNEGNRLILPAGILRWPFFHVSASHGWNYGGIGAAIGHEMTHAFDMDGKEYDFRGQIGEWWTEGDKKDYSKRVKSLKKLFSESVYEGKHLDGALTLSENIADLGGLGIALEALKTVLKKEGLEGDAYWSQIRDFFHSYAVSWRTKQTHRKALQSLFMDVHAPAPARVNNIVCQFDDWYEAFKISPTDALYKDPHERIRIF